MKTRKIVNNLKNRKGYYNNGQLKKGTKWLANHYGVTQEIIVKAIKIIREDEKIINQRNIIKSNSNRKLESIKYDNTIFSKNIKLNRPGVYFVTGCTHIPWHNKQMFNSIFKFLSTIKLEGVILAGDILDLNSLSSHDKGKISLKGVTLEEEYKEGSKFLDKLDQVTNNATTVFMFGNHEDRYLRTLSDVDKSKYGTALKSPVEGLKLLTRGYKVITDWKEGVVELGKDLDIIHGEFINVYTAKKSLDTYKKSTMYVHTHREQVYKEGDLAAYNIGSGADFNAPIFNYATRSMKQSWSNSSALVTVDKDLKTHVEILNFKNGKLCVGGKLY